MTFAGGDLNKVGRNEFVPAREFQLRWCHCYLMGYKGLKENQVKVLYTISMLRVKCFIKMTPVFTTGVTLGRRTPVGGHTKV